MCNRNDNDNLKFHYTHVEKLSSNVCIYDLDKYDQKSHTRHTSFVSNAQSENSYYP